MSSKELICPERRRRVPEGFGWVDHRLVRDGHFKNCGGGPLALYLFLITVGDSDGMSWYSDRTLSEHLACGLLEVGGYRRQLEAAGLVAYRRPHYQVLDLSPSSYDTETFSELLRRATRERGRKADDAAGRDIGVGVVSPAYRRPDGCHAPRLIGSVVRDMIGGGE